MILTETKSTTYSLREGILVSSLKPGHLLNLQDAMQNLESRESLPITFPIPILIDIRALEDASFESVIATTNPRDSNHFKAAALLVSTAVHAFMIREAKRFRTVSVPIKVFTSEEDAMVWLRSFK